MFFAIISVNSGIQLPQLVPALSAEPICSTVCKESLLIASIIVLIPTLKQEQTILPSSFAPDFLPANKLKRVLGPISLAIKIEPSQLGFGHSLLGDIKNTRSRQPLISLALRNLCPALSSYLIISPSFPKIFLAQIKLSCGIFKQPTLYL